MTPLRGSGLLIGLTLRRDRVMLPLWMGAVVATVMATISAFDDLYPDRASRGAFAATIRANLVFRAFYGPLYSGATNGALTAWRTGTIGAVILALMSTFLITRHTRREEETGRLELVGSTTVGRLAPLVAALVVAAGANLVAASLCTAVLVAAGEDAAGATAFGLGLAGGGLVFGAIAAVAAQVTETARAANSLTLAVLGIAFLLRAVGDGTAGWTWVSWMSPLGWVGQVRAFAGDRTAVVALLFAAAVVGGAAAVLLNARRDLGGSLLRTRPGPARAARGLTGPLALERRRQRTAVAGWSVAFLLLGVVFGALTDSIGSLVDSSPQIAEVLRQIGGPGALVDGYLAGVLGIVGLFAAGFGVSAALRLRTDETAQLVEPVLATRISRLRLLATQMVWVWGVPAGLTLLAGFAAGAAADATMGDAGGHLWSSVAGAALQIPAVWVMAGFAMLLFGVLPRWSAAAWAALGVSALLAEIGPVLNLPHAVLDVSPFTAVPRWVGDAPVSVVPLVVLTLVAVAFAAVGAVGFRRRDIG